MWINDEKWNRIPAESLNGQADMAFMLNGGEAYAMIIHEEIDIPLVTLKNAAINNAKAVADDLEILLEEYRMVNDNQVICLQMQGSAQGASFVYFSYYYTSEKGAVQLTTFTNMEQFKAYRPHLESFLDGFVTFN
ncbi:MAG: hypothetical protein AAFR61_08485 [Bacteroidota bacterium]